MTVNKIKISTLSIKKIDTKFISNYHISKWFIINKLSIIWRYKTNLILKYRILNKMNRFRRGSTTIDILPDHIQGFVKGKALQATLKGINIRTKLSNVETK